MQLLLPPRTFIYLDGFQSQVLVRCRLGLGLSFGCSRPVCRWVALDCRLRARGGEKRNIICYDAMICYDMVSPGRTRSVYIINTRKNKRKKKKKEEKK